MGEPKAANWSAIEAPQATTGRAAPASEYSFNGRIYAVAPTEESVDSAAREVLPVLKSWQHRAIVNAAE
jgi:hypothetical protein